MNIFFLTEEHKNIRKTDKQMNKFFLDRGARRRKETLATEGTQEHKNIRKIDKHNLKTKGKESGGRKFL